MRSTILQFSILLIFLSGPQRSLCSEDSLLAISQGTITFVSEAPLELINARTEKIQGLVKVSDGSFAFSILISSFEGFNSELQKTHFNENYLESDLYPKATFAGKIIEGLDLKTAGVTEFRAKGILNIHGVKQERIINVTMDNSQGKRICNSEFTILLRDHDISVPKIVYQKIAQEIIVTVHFQLATNQPEGQ